MIGDWADFVRWIEDGDDAALERCATTVVSSGTLSEARAKAVEALRDMGAWAAWAEAQMGSQDYGDMLLSALENFEPSELVCFLQEALKRASTAWGLEFARDKRPLDALQAIRNRDVWTAQLIDDMGRAAANAGVELDFPEFTEDQDWMRARAMNFAAAVGDGCIAVVEMLSGNDAESREAASSAAKFAVKAAAQPVAEREWQRRFLRSVLMFSAPLPSF